MSTFDYVFPLLLIQSVVRQLRGKHLSWFQLAWPVGVVTWAAAKYLHGIPSGVADAALVAACTLAGFVLGLLAGGYTRIYRRGDGALMARATPWALLFWVVGTIGRLAFGLYAEHGGGTQIAAFSHEAGLNVRAWGPSLILMALSEVLGRTVVLGTRALRVRRTRPGATTAQ